MIKFKFDLAGQINEYEKVKEKLKTDFYQKLHFYVLPEMPEKFRNRVVFLPKKCDPKIIYKKHRFQIDKLESEWNKSEKLFSKKLKVIFPKIDIVEIVISPVFYGTVGTYELDKNKIIVSPRYDRSILNIQKLVINALTHYFYFGYKIKLNNDIEKWHEKQSLTTKFQEQIFGKGKSMLKILDTEFAGKLAQKSTTYLEDLGYPSNKPIDYPANLTKNEKRVFDLLLKNINKLVTFEEIGDVLWEDTTDKYSEYAITKLIERLKKKLPPRFIHSQRGVGYILHR